MPSSESGPMVGTASRRGHSKASAPRRKLITPPANANRRPQLPASNPPLDREEPTCGCSASRFALGAFDRSEVRDARRVGTPAGPLPTIGRSLATSGQKRLISSIVRARRVGCRSARPGRRVGEPVSGTHMATCPRRTAVKPGRRLPGSGARQGEQRCRQDRWSRRRGTGRSSPSRRRLHRLR